GPRRVHVRDDVGRHAHRPQEVEEMEQLVPHVLEVRHRHEDVHRVNDDEVDPLPLIPPDEEVPQDAEPVADLLRAFVLDAEPRDVDEELAVRPEAVVPLRVPPGASSAPRAYRFEPTTRPHPAPSRRDMWTARVNLLPTTDVGGIRYQV